MHAIVEQPLTQHTRGRISCRPLGQEPIVFEWTPPTGVTLTLDATRSEATDVAPGRYRVSATDATSSRAELAFDVAPLYADAVTVEEYRVTPASTATSRDGGVEAVGGGLQDGWRFLWTTGVETSSPVLRDVPCGTYAVTALARPGEDDAPLMLHTCPPARVRVGTDVSGRLGARSASEGEPSSARRSVGQGRSSRPS